MTGRKKGRRQNDKKRTKPKGQRQKDKRKTGWEEEKVGACKCCLFLFCLSVWCSASNIPERHSAVCSSSLWYYGLVFGILDWQLLLIMNSFRGNKKDFTGRHSHDLSILLLTYKVLYENYFLFIDLDISELILLLFNFGNF